MLMYKLQSTKDCGTWLVVRIFSAEDGHERNTDSFRTVVILQTWVRNQVSVCFGPPYG